MSDTLLIVRDELARFNPWEHAGLGVGAQLDALGIDGHGLEIEYLKQPKELLEVADGIRHGGMLPARAIVFEDSLGTELAKDEWGPDGLFYAVTPENYRDGDPEWTTSADRDPSFTRYSRLIASRLVHRVVPDAYFIPTDDEVCQMLGYDAPDYSGALAAVNRHLSVTGEDFMVVVDARHSLPINETPLLEGADVDARDPGSKVDVPAEFPANLSLVDIPAVRRAGMIARILKGEYPGAGLRDIELVLPRELQPLR